MFARINKKFGLLILPLLFPSFSHAQVFINEIMYDLSGTDTSREWVEIYNTGSNPIDLSTYKFSEATTNHAIKNISGGTNIASGSYAVIADDTNKFLLDWPGFSGNLFDSSFSLNNTGATLTLKDSTGGALDQVVYTSTQGANGDGNTLQKSSSGWIVSGPTPGALNSSTAIVGTTTPPTENGTSTTATGGGGAISSHYSFVSISDYVEYEQFSISAGRDRLTSVGNSIDLEVRANSSDNNVRYLWSFGDGTTASGKKVKHIYEYPGDYAVVVNGVYLENNYVSRLKVKVISPKLSIEVANGEYIQIKNSSGFEVNLFGSEIESGGSVFKFPKDTIILNGASNMFSSKVTNLYPNTVSDVVFKSISTTSSPATKIPDNRQELTELYEKTVSMQNQLSLMSKSLKPEITQEIVEKPTGQVKVENVATPLLATPIVSANRSWIDILKQFFFGK